MNDVLTNLIIKSIRQLTEAVDRLENSILKRFKAVGE